MSFSEERRLIETHLANNFDSSLVPIAYDNMSALKAGNSVIKDFNSVPAWVRLTIQGAGSEQVDLGGNVDRYQGLIIINIFTKASTGSKNARAIVDQLLPVFNRVILNNIMTQTTEVVTTPAANGWYQTTMSTEYYRDEVSRKYELYDC